MMKGLVKNIFIFHNKNIIKRSLNILDIIRNIKKKSTNSNIDKINFTFISHIANMSTKEVIKHFRSNIKGLTYDNVTTLQENLGLNAIETEIKRSNLYHLWTCYSNPFNILLSVLAIVSFVTGELKATVVISIMVIVSTLLRFFQERKSYNATSKLKEMVSNTVFVLRQNSTESIDAPTNSVASRHNEIEVPIEQLVVGDIVLLSAGNMIPADLKIIIAKDLFISQSTMTGETEPIEKFATLNNHSETNQLDFSNMLFMGTNVISGSAVAIVVATGKNTYFGGFAEKVIAKKSTNAFHTGVNKVSWLLIQFMFAMVPVVLIINGLSQHDWLNASLFALSVAVGLTPEMLPMIVNSTLIKGALSLSKKKVIVKHIDAIQNFGAMNILCTDKTGTLTQDKIFLEKHTDVFGAESNSVLEYAYINSYYQTGLKNLLDVAVLEKIDIEEQLKIKENFFKVDEIPFDFNRRRMSVVVNEFKDHNRLICKGALEEILDICKHVVINNNISILNEEILNKITKIANDLNKDGLRVLAVATREFPIEKTSYSKLDESELVLIGYIAFLDPPKETTAPAVKALKEHGVELKILTGDNELVTQKVCKEVGINIQGIMNGSELSALNDNELYERAKDINVFVKLTPIHKERIIQVLQNNGNVVGFMGDGINDAPALKTADVGISVDTAVDIAKEAADIVLLEKSLMVLEQGIIEGRRTFNNMLKYICITASSNFGNVFSLIFASFFLPFLPILPLQLLLQNLLYDISQTTIPFDNVDEELIKKPQQWNTKHIGMFMLFFGPLSSIFDLITYAVLWYILGFNTLDKQSLFQTGWFIEGLITQVIIVHIIRTNKIPFLQSNASTPVIIMTLGIVCLALTTAMSSIGSYFKMEVLPVTYFVFLPIIIISYVMLVQFTKKFYFKNFSY